MVLEREVGYEPSAGVIGWKAWYTNDRFYSSATDSWTALPNSGVLVIMLYFSGILRRVLAGTEYYVLDGGEFNHKHTLPPSGEVKRAPATLIPDAEFNAIYDAAMEDFVIP